MSNEDGAGPKQTEREQEKLGLPRGKLSPCGGGKAGAGEDAEGDGRYWRGCNGGGGSSDLECSVWTVMLF